jgi:hypothetical protein
MRAFGTGIRISWISLCLAVESLESAYEALDTRYFSVDSTDLLVKKIDEWLRTLDCLRSLHDEDLVKALEGAKRRNHLYAIRAEEMAQFRRAFEEGSALHRVVKSLCQSAGLRFLRFTAGGTIPMRMVSSAAPDRTEFYWGVMTTGAVHHVFFYKEKGFLRTKLKAEMWFQNASEPAASCAVSSSDYEEILPRWKRGGRSPRVRPCAF